MQGKSKTIKKDIKITKPEYSAKFKMDVIASYTENSFDAAKTAKQMGVSEVLVKEWWKETGLSLPASTGGNIPMISTASQGEIARLDEENALEIRKAQATILNRLQVQIEMCDDPEVTIKALEAITRAIKESKEEAGTTKAGVKKSGVYNNINAQYNQFIMNNKAPKKNGNN